MKKLTKEQLNKFGNIPAKTIANYIITNVVHAGADWDTEAKIDGHVRAIKIIAKKALSTDKTKIKEVQKQSLKAYGEIIAIDLLRFAKFACDEAIEQGLDFKDGLYVFGGIGAAFRATMETFNVHNNELLVEMNNLLETILNKAGIK